MVSKLESLADAIMAYSGYSDPKHLFYRLRNPGGLKAFSSRHAKDPSGYRYFESLVDGYKALVYDLEIKCKGQSNSGLQTDAPLLELTRVFGMKDDTCRYVVKFLRKALSQDALNEEVPLKFFMEL